MITLNQCTKATLSQAKSNLTVSSRKRRAFSFSPARPGCSRAMSSIVSLDYLVIDEAGQVALADALAMGTSARNLVLLGDPFQLEQVSQGIHPPGTGASVLEHLLGEAPTIPEDRGIFLEKSYRMHPAVCAFISEIVYAGRLHSDDSAARRTTSSGHRDPLRSCGARRQSHRVRRGGSADSETDCRAAAGDIHRLPTAPPGSSATTTSWSLLPTTLTCAGCARALPAGVRVGTVDKFQGQQAPIVLFSMATSSGEDVPRNLAFLFSRNRLNVAISRAQCLAYLVCSPRLLEARCKSIEEMELVNALVPARRVRSEERCLKEKKGT